MRRRRGYSEVGDPDFEPRQKQVIFSQAFLKRSLVFEAKTKNGEKVFNNFKVDSYFERGKSGGILDAKNQK